MEKIIITGNVGKEPTTKEMKGKTYTSFSVGVNQGKDRPTNWYNVNLFGDKTSVISKGAKLMVIGRPELKVWKESVDRTIWADSFEFLGPPVAKAEATSDDLDFPV